MDDERVNNNDRIQQLERERDELRKDIEQLCMQQAGPTYLAVATRMHFQRTAGLEQEIDNLKKKLAICTRNNSNLQEELSEVYHIKSQLADLHNAEVTKNMEAEKQLKFFQGCVATAFAERDHALMEAEKAKEREHFMSQEVNSLRERIEEMTSDFIEEKSSRDVLQTELTKLKEQIENFEKVVTKFYDIRQSFLGVIEDTCLDSKCECLLQDAPETWSFNSNVETPPSEYISALEKELDTLKSCVDRHQNKMRVGLEIEDHLRKRVHELEKEKILFGDLVKDKISKLYHSHSQHRCEVVELLENEKTQLRGMIGVLHEQIKELHDNRMRDFGPPQGDAGILDIECHDVHITSEVDTNIASKKKYLVPPNIVAQGSSDTADAFAQALQEKVSALLLLSQEEERHLLERNVNSALQKKIEELQRNLFQVTNEKVKALMELAQLRQDFQLLQENISQGIKQGTLLAEISDKSVSDNGKEGKLKNMLKKTYLKHWISRPDFGVDTHINSNEGDLSNKRSNYPVDFARLKIEYATLKESIESVEHLTSTVHRLRQSLVKDKESSTSLNYDTSIVASLDSIITEANLIKTALGSSLPVSRSAKADTEPFGKNPVIEPTYDTGDPSKGKLDSVSAAGFEMVELLILAAGILKESVIQKASGIVS